MSAGSLSPESPPSVFNPTYHIVNGTEITNEQLDQCARLFSENYAVWDAPPHRRVKMSAKKLREECLARLDCTVLVTCLWEEKLIGHAFATTWDCENDTVGWVTQLVVDSKWRRRHVATNLIRQLRNHVPLLASVTIVGVASSHPVTCGVVAKFAGLPIGDIDLQFISKNANRVLQSSPVSYLKNASLRGSLFEGDLNNDSNGAISSVFTDFPILHNEPLAVLSNFEKEGRGWYLGKLLGGHEFLVVIPVSS